MQRQQKEFHEIFDVAALRILVSDVETCYRALAVVHDTFRPIPGRFKDYIGLPKPNGYQSLHTAVIGRHRPIEVQIRTPEMLRVSEFGIAAHWKYKEGGSPANPDSEKFNWLRQLVEWQQEDGVNDHNDYLASIKEDLSNALLRREALLRLVDPVCLGDFKWFVFKKFNEKKININSTCLR